MKVEHRYAVTPEQLYRVLTDVAYLTERGRRYGGAAPPVVQTSPGEVVVTSVRQVTVDKLPSVARRYVGDGRLVQVDRWKETAAADGAREASLTVEAGGMPIEINGRHDIRPAANGCIYVMTIEITVKVAVVGRVIRRGVETQLNKLLTAELAFTERWLSQTVS